MVNNNNNNCNIKYSVNLIFITIIKMIIIGVTGVRTVRAVRNVLDVRTVRASVSNKILLFVVLISQYFFPLHSTPLLYSSHYSTICYTTSKLCSVV